MNEKKPPLTIQKYTPLWRLQNRQRQA